MPKINWDQVRSEYKVCDKYAYLMSAAVGPYHREVYKSTAKHMAGLYEIGDPYYMDSVERMEKTREKVGQILNCQGSDIAFSPSTSYGMNTLAMMFKQGSKRQIIVPADEFPSSCLPWAYHGLELVKIPSHNGFIDQQEILAAITHETAAVVCSAIQFGTGFRMHINQLGKHLAAKEIPFIVNGTQAFGAFPIDIKKAKISALTASCHKWMGAGYGVSVLCLSPALRNRFAWPLAGWLSVEDPMAMSNDLAPLKRETAAIELGVPPFSILAGLDAACDVVMDLGINNIANRIFELTTILTKQLRGAGVKILSPRDILSIDESINSGIVSIEVDRPEEVEQSLRANGIFVSARRGSLRISTHYFNNENDFNRLLSMIG